MKYLAKGIAIHSDRAAIPSGRRSKRLIRLLSAIGSHESCIDYGCGKLRHVDLLIRLFRRVTLVDSEAQLGKTQTIHGRQTTIRKYCRHYGRGVAVIAAEDISRLRKLHDWAFCINVLSAIPCETTRVKILTQIRRLLKRRGQLLLITQYSNSKFNRFSEGKKFLDGHIFRSARGYHFFGRIPLSKIRTYLRKAGFTAYKTQQADGYLITTTTM